MNVLVTNANSRTALCIARALAKTGHQVTVADYIPHSMAFFSRYVSYKFIYPSPYSNPHRFIEIIKKNVIDRKLDAIIPVYEETFLLAKHSRELLPIVNLALPQYKNILTVHNKDILAKTLGHLNIKHPVTYHLSEFSNYNDIRKKILSRNIVIKPRQGGGSWGVLKLKNDQNIVNKIQKYLSETLIDKERLLVQEWIPYKIKYSNVIIYNNGKIVQDFTFHHFRAFPPDAGNCTLRVTCSSGIMKEISKKLFDYLCWHGVAEIEYVIHSKTGTHYLVEVNPRIWGSVNSAIAAGINIPEILLKIAKKEVVQPLTYPIGLKSRWFWGDILAFPHYFQSSQKKVNTICDYISPLIDGTEVDEFCWNDPIPFFIWPMHVIVKVLKSRSFTHKSYDTLDGEWQ